MLTRVVVVGHAVIETPALQRLAGEGVSVFFLSGRHLRFSGVLTGRTHYNAALRVRQYEKTLDPGFCRETARALVSRKLFAQKSFLFDAMEQRPELRLQLKTACDTLDRVSSSLEQETDIDRMRGLEGGAAASYFQAFTTLFAPSLGFVKRTKRPPEDPVNALLSLGYTLLHYEMLREVQLIGLDPVLGFLHQFDYGRDSLVCDLVEPFRPAVDRWVWELFRNRMFTERDFTTGDDRPGCYMKKEARRIYYELYESWASAQRPLWTEYIRTFARSINNGQDPVSEREQGAPGEEGRPVSLDP